MKSHFAGKLFISFVTLLFTLSLVAAAGLDVKAEIDLLKPDFEGQVVPPPFGGFLGDQKINIYTTLESGTIATVSIILKDKKIESIALGEVEKPTLKVYLTQTVLKNIAESSDPLQSLRQALEEGKVTYQAVGFFNKLKFNLSSVLAKLFAKSKEQGSENQWKDTKNETPDKNPNAPKPEEKGKPSGLTGAIIQPVTENPSSNNNPPSAAPQAQVKEEPVVIKEVDTVQDDDSIHIVEMTDLGFKPDVLTIKLGDTIEWKNVRPGKKSVAMIIGTQKCFKIRSDFYGYDQSFGWTFTEPVRCLFVDGAMTTKSMKVIVE